MFLIDAVGKEDTDIAPRLKMRPGRLAAYLNGETAVPERLIQQFLDEFHEELDNWHFGSLNKTEQAKLLSIEPGIKPLVDALNATGLVKTFSSCEGHFGKTGKHYRDRNFADVRFVPVKGVKEHAIQTLLEYIITEAESKDLPAEVEAQKKYLPHQHISHRPVHLLLIRPGDDGLRAAAKRACTDQGIKAVTQIVRKATRLLKSGKALVPDRGSNIYL